jgi:hypothetical protein
MRTIDLRIAIPDSPGGKRRGSPGKIPAPASPPANSPASQPRLRSGFSRWRCELERGLDILLTRLTTTLTPQACRPGTQPTPQHDGSDVARSPFGPLWLSVQLGQVGAYWSAGGEYGQVKDSQAQGGKAPTALDAAAVSMARGASGIWLRAGSRLGLVCRGAVYLLVGYLAFRLALASHGRTGAPASSAGAVQAAVAGTGGRSPLVLLVAGLAAYALTQLLEAVFRAARATSTTGKWRQRAMSSWGFLLYSAFCLTTARLLAGTPAKQTAQSEQRQDTGMAADLLHTGWGKALLVVAGILVVAGGLEAGRRAVRLDFRERFTAEHMSRALAMITRALGAFGSLARAVVFVLTGVFLIRAAVLSTADQTKGLDAVFRSVASSQYGPWLLALLASGLFCYGLYCLLEARYRDLTPGR